MSSLEESLARGLDEVERGETYDLGSFTGYVEGGHEEEGCAGCFVLQVAHVASARVRTYKEEDRTPELIWRVVEDAIVQLDPQDMGPEISVKEWLEDWNRNWKKILLATLEVC
jgi:hypothetical protein